MGHTSVSTPFPFTSCHDADGRVLVYPTGPRQPHRLCTQQVQWAARWRHHKGAEEEGEGVGTAAQAPQELPTAPAPRLSPASPLRCQRHAHRCREGRGCVHGPCFLLGSKLTLRASLPCKLTAASHSMSTSVSTAMLAMSRPHV